MFFVSHPLFGGKIWCHRHCKLNFSCKHKIYLATRVPRVRAVISATPTIRKARPFGFVFYFTKTNAIYSLLFSFSKNFGKPAIFGITRMLAVVSLNFICKYVTVFVSAPSVIFLDIFRKAQIVTRYLSAI